MVIDFLFLTQQSLGVVGCYPQMLCDDHHAGGLVQYLASGVVHNVLILSYEMKLAFIVFSFYLRRSVF